MNRELSFVSLFFEVLIRPKKVMHLILDKNPDFYVWPMVGVFSIISSINAIRIPSQLINSLPIPFTLLIELLLGIGESIFFFLFISWILFQIGKWIGGMATYKEIMTAFAWGSIPPYCFGSLFKIIEVVPYWSKYLSEDSNTIVPTTRPFIGFHISIFSLFLIWSLILTFSTVAVAHKFTGWKSVIFISLLFGFVTVLFGGVNFYLNHNVTAGEAQKHFEEGEELFNQKKYQEAMWTYQGVGVLAKKFNTNLLNLAQKKEWVCRAYLNDWTPSEGPRSADVRLIYPEIYAKYKAELAQITPIPQISK